MAAPWNGQLAEPGPITFGMALTEFPVTHCTQVGPCIAV